MKNVFYALFLSLFLSACSFLQDKKITENEFKDTEFEIISAHNKQKVNFDEFIDLIGTYDIILLGEKHDEYNHHLAEYFIIKALHEIKNINVVFEMLSTDKQNKIDTAKADKENIKPPNLAKAIEWEKSWRWKDYQNIVELVFYKDIKMSAGNLSKAEISTIYQGAQQLNGFVSTKNSVKEMIKTIIMNNHKIDTNSTENSTLLDMLVQIQQYKDRRMADIVVQSKEKAVLIAGRHHTDKRIGIPLHIQDFKSSKKVVVVIFGASEKEVEFAEADYFYLFK